MFSVWPFTLVVLVAMYRLGKGRETWHKIVAGILCFVPFVAQMLRASLFMSMQWSGHNGSIGAIWRHHYDKQLLTLWVQVGLCLLVYTWSRRRSGGGRLFSRRKAFSLLAVAVALTIAAIIVLAPYKQLYTAAHHGDIPGIRKALKPWVNPNTMNDWFETPLLLAAREGHWDAVDVLIDEGADVNQVLPYLESVAVTTLERGDLDATLALLERGARVDFSDRHVEYSRDVVRWIVRREERGMGMNSEALKLLLEAGLSPVAAVTVNADGGDTDAQDGNPTSLWEFFCANPADARCEILRAWKE
jgi:hypothetical protein